VGICSGKYNYEYKYFHDHYLDFDHLNEYYDNDVYEYLYFNKY
jgi:hypothetical protein